MLAQGPVILHVDDDADNREALNEILQAEGFQVEEAATGAEALRRAADQPDVILLDVQLGDMSGFEVCRRIKTNPVTAGIPILQLSGHFIRPEDRLNGLGGGADAYLTKPIEPEILIAHIRAHLRIRRAEKEARITARQWQTTFDAVRDGICLLDSKGNIVRCNRALGEFLGTAPEQLVGRPYADLEKRAQHVAPPAPPEAAHHRLLPSLQIGERWFRVNQDPIAEESGLGHAAVVVWTEVTEWKQAEESLRQSQARLARAQQIAHLGSWEWNPATNAVRWSEEVYRIFGFTPQREEPSFEAFLLRVPVEDQAVITQALTDTLEKGIPYNVDHRILLPNGELRTVNEQAVPVRDAQGKIVRFLGTVLDITDRKQAEEALRLQAQILEQIHDAVVVTDLKGTITSWNRGAERLHGFTAAEMLGRPVATLFPENERAVRQVEIARALMAAGKYEGEIAFLKKGGGAVEVHLSLSILRNAAGHPTGTVGYALDISQRKVLEDQLRQSQKMEAIGHLAGGVAHDFNNLLTVITGYSDLLLQNIAPQDPAHEMIQQIQKAGDRAANLTRQLLAFSRKQILQPVVLDLNAVITDLEKMLLRLIGEDIDLATDLDETLCNVRADRGQIEQVILNLVVNARDAMPQGGRLRLGTRAVTLDEAYTQKHLDVRPGNYARIEVTDTGHGIPPEIQARIFEPFFTTKEIGKGTGLGLATVHGIIKQSSGHLEVISAVDQGTAFHLYLPCLPPEEKARAAQEKNQKLASGQETILLAEDEEGLRTLTQMALEKAGYQVLVARDGNEALALAQQHPGVIDLLVSDVVMPHLGGRVLADALRALFPQLKVLFVSGYTEEAVLRHGVLQSEIAFLQKPFTRRT